MSRRSCGTPSSGRPQINTDEHGFVARDTSFYYSFLVLPAAKRQAIVAVWDFCRAVDAAGDEAPVGTSAAQVARWRDELARCFDGRPPETPQGRALAALVPAVNLARRPPRVLCRCGAS